MPLEAGSPLAEGYISKKFT